MVTALQQAFLRMSFSRQFMLAIIVVLAIGMTAIGSWVARLIETNAVNRTAEISAVYLESILAVQLSDWPCGSPVNNKTHTELDHIFVAGPLRHEVVRFKLWDADGRIDYSSDHEQNGLRFPVRGLLGAAFGGTVQSRMSKLDESDNQPEQARWPELLEIYVPIRSGSDDKIIAVAEFYLSADHLRREIRSAQLHSWAMVALSTLAIYLFLFGMVSRASNTIQAQQHNLRQQLQQLRNALNENDHMRERLREAGVSTTTLNEEFLIRIAADLHDGPAQTIAFALMRFDEFAANCRKCASSPSNTAQELHSIQSALQSSLRDVRKISSGLAIPGIAELSLADTARHAVRDFEHLSGLTVQSDIDESLVKAPLSVKITVYRLLQESLTNCWRHAPKGSPAVHIQRTDGEVLVTVTDHGAGFDAQAAAIGGRLGLAFMRERVRLLGGIFEIDSAPGSGTVIRARLPLSTVGMLHD
ncbi:MAG: sensor histidine kinase [Gammaproteobacteria bacterium]|nr:sensor histidine kinase [Gammaproteobacteria bacterium]MBU1481299.1 sensor histidine kinase [Gammaproteobacteria bacterium]